MYLLDTNICIFAIKKKLKIVLDYIAKNLEHGIFISSLTIAELEFGISNSMYLEKNRFSLLKFLSIFETLDFTEKDSIPYGKLKTEVRSKGNQIGPIDMLLAGQALSNNLILVTNNTREFERVTDLIIQDWTH